MLFFNTLQQLCHPLYEVELIKKHRYFLTVSPKSKIMLIITTSKKWRKIATSVVLHRQSYSSLLSVIGDFLYVKAKE